MKLKTINYPVFYLPSVPFVEEGISYINDKIVDDKTLKQRTLGARRLELKMQEKSLHPLSKALFYYKDILKFSSMFKSSVFIDSLGNVFVYERSRFVPLICRKITKVLHLATGGAVLEVDNESCRYKVLFAPKPLEKYAGFLVMSPKVYTLYGLYEEEFKTTKRKI